MESLSDQLHDNLLLTNNVELTDEDNRVKNVEHSSSEGDTRSGDHDGEKSQNEVTVTDLSDSPNPNIDSCPAPLVSNAQIPNFESPLSEATSSSELSKLNQLDIISPNATYDSLDLANNRIEAARSHQSQHSSEELASPPRPLSCADGLTSQEYEQFVLSILNVNICKNEKDRRDVQWIEQQLADFIADDRTGYKRFEEMTSYHRMLVHRVAEYYRLYHHVDQSGKCVVVSKQTATINSPAAVLAGQGSVSSSLNSSQNLTLAGSPASSGKTNALFSAAYSANGDVNSLDQGQNQARVSNQQISPGGALSATGKSANMSSSPPRTSSNSSVGTGMNDLPSSSGPLNGTLWGSSGASNMKSSGSNMIQQGNTITGQRFPHGDRGHKSNNSGSTLSGVAGEYGVIASTGAGNNSQYTNYGGLKKKPHFPNVNKRMLPYTDQAAAFGGSRKTSLGGYHSQPSSQQQPGQGTGRYGAMFGDGGSGMRPPRNPNSSAVSRSAKTGLYDSVYAVPSINNRMRYPNKGSVHGNHSHHNFSAATGSRAHLGTAYGGVVSVSSHAPFSQMLPASFPFPNIIAKPDGSISVASANAAAAAQLHRFSLGPEDINASLPAGQINITPSGGFHQGAAAAAFTENAAIPFNWVYAPHSAASAAAAATALQIHTAGAPNLAIAASGASNNYVTGAAGASNNCVTATGGPSIAAGFYPANIVNPAPGVVAGGLTTNVPLGMGISMQQPLQQNLAINSAAASSSGSNTAKLLSQQQPSQQQQQVQPNTNNSSSAISSDVKNGGTGSSSNTYNGSSAAANTTASSGVSTGAGEMVPNGSSTGTGSQGSINSSSSFSVGPEDLSTRQQNKSRTQKQTGARVNTNASTTTCTSPSGDEGVEKDATKSSELELSGPTDVKSATARASVEGASQGPLKNGQSQPAVDCKSLEKGPSLSNGSTEIQEMQSSGAKQMVNNIQEQEKDGPSSVNINGTTSSASASQTSEKIVASSNMYPAGGPVYSIVAGTNGYPMEQMSVPLTNLPNAWNATANTSAQQLMQIPSFNMSPIYQQELINAAASKNQQLAAMNMATINPGSGCQSFNAAASVLQNTSTDYVNINSNQLNGIGAFGVNSTGSYYGIPVAGQMYQTGAPNVGRGAGVGSVGIPTGHGAIMFPVAPSGNEQQQHGMTNLAIISQPANQSAATIPGNQQCPSIIPVINHNQVTGAVAAYPNEQIASVMQPYLKHHSQYQFASSSLTGATHGLQCGSAVGAGPAQATAAAPFMQQMSPMNPQQTTPLAQTTAPPSNSYASPDTMAQPMIQQPPSSSGATGGAGQQHVASTASFNTFHSANAAALARINFQKTIITPQQQQAAAAAVAQQQPGRLAAIPLYQTPPQMYAAAAANNAAAASALYGPAAYTYGMLVSRMPHQPQNPAFSANTIVPSGLYSDGAGVNGNIASLVGSGASGGSLYGMQSTRNHGNTKGHLRNNAANGAKSPKLKSLDLEISSKSGTNKVPSNTIKSQ